MMNLVVIKIYKYNECRCDRFHLRNIIYQNSELWTGKAWEIAIGEPKKEKTKCWPRKESQEYSVLEGERLDGFRKGREMRNSTERDTSVLLPGDGEKCV